VKPSQHRGGGGEEQKTKKTNLVGNSFKRALTFGHIIINSVGTINHVRGGWTTQEKEGVARSGSVNPRKKKKETLRETQGKESPERVKEKTQKNRQGNDQGKTLEAGFPEQPKEH